MSEIRQHVQRLNLPAPVHFTRLENLSSILRHGLYPKSDFRELANAPIINDEFRLDGHEDAISLSLGHPNHRMFYKLRQENQSVDWVVLLIHRAILWRKPCGFCAYNAADSRVSCISIEELQSTESFLRMFEGDDRPPYLLDSDPTDDQAEVLVFGRIDPEYIQGVVFQTYQAKQESAHLTGDLQTRVHGKTQGLFASRSYKRQWS